MSHHDAPPRNARADPHAGVLRRSRLRDAWAAWQAAQAGAAGQPVFTADRLLGRKVGSFMLVTQPEWHAASRRWIAKGQRPDGGLTSIAFQIDVAGFDAKPVDLPVA